jgi:DNA-binding MarR family transcriptional regulator
MIHTELHTRPGHLIRRAQQIAVSIFHEECGAFGITPVQYSILRLLDSQEGIDQVSLANHSAIDRSTMANIAERLEEKGWIKRIQSVEDKRQKLLYLTAVGKDLLESVEKFVDATQQRIMAPLSSTEAKVFLELLEKIVDFNNEVSRAPLRKFEESLK